MVETKITGSGGALREIDASELAACGATWRGAKYLFMLYRKVGFFSVVWRGIEKENGAAGAPAQGPRED